MRLPVRSFRNCVLLFILCATGIASAVEDVEEEFVSAEIRLLVHHRVAAVSLGGDEVYETMNSESESQDSIILYYRDGARYEPISVQQNRLSRTFSYRGPQEFYLYEQSINEEEETVYAPRMSGFITRDGPVYFIAHPARSSEGLQQLIALNANPEELGVGSFLAVNLSSISVHVATEAQRLRIDSFASELIDVSNAEPLRFRILLAVANEGGFQPVYQRIWPIRPDLRGIVLFYPVNDEGTRWNSEIFRLR